MTVPAVNVSREDTATMTRNLNAAYPNLRTAGNPLAPAYTPNTWGGDVQRHHAIPVKIFKQLTNI